MKKSIIVQFIAIILLAISFILVDVQKNMLYDQTAAKRWSDSKMDQITVYYPFGEAPSEEYYFLDLSHRIESELEKSAVAEDLAIDKESGLSFPFAYSTSGQLTITSEKGEIKVNAIGVSGDYFTFHPIGLSYGSYITADDNMDDGIIIDNEAAWKLFGSNDIVGMPVEIGGIPHYIKGVMMKNDDRFSKSAGLEESICFVSMASLNNYGVINGNYSYELIIPDPVENFAINILRSTMGDSINSLMVIENTHRFNSKNLWTVLKNTGVRSMSGKGIVYPYYENVARAWEDVFARVLAIQIILIAIIIITAFLFVIALRRSEQYKVLVNSIKKAYNKRRFLD